MSDTVKKWVSTGKRLNAETDGAEKKIVSFLPKELEVSREHQLLEKNRAEHKAHVVKQVSWFRSTLDQVQIKLDEKPGYNERQTKAMIQQLLETFEARLSSFKLVMRGEFDRLEEEERVLTMDISGLEQNLIAYTSQSNLPEVNEEEEEKRKEAQLVRNQQRFHDDVAHKAAVGEVDRELASLGKFGDWDPRDHDAFVRVWNSTFAGIEVLQRIMLHPVENARIEIKDDQPETNEMDRSHNNANVGYELQLHPSQRTQLIKKMEFHVLGKSKEEINAHIEWYGKVLALNAKKKLLLADWRKAQAARRKSLPSDSSVDPSLPNGEEDRAKQAAEEELDEDRLAKEEEKARKLEEQRVNAKMRIAKWKVDKQKQEEMEKIQKVRQAELELKEAQEEKKQKQAATRMQLESWKQSTAAKNGKVSVSPPRKTDPGELRKRQEKDIELARQRKEKFDEQAMKTSERDRKISELVKDTPPVAVAERDPARLLAGTKAYEAGRLQSEDLDAADQKRSTRGAHSANIAMSGRDLQFTGRAKPTWMKPPK